MFWFILFIICVALGYNPAMKTLRLAGSESTPAGKIASGMAVLCLSLLLLFALTGLL